MSLKIYNYHRVKRSPDETTAFDDRVFSVTADVLGRLAKRLKRDTDLLDESALIDVIENPSRMPRRASAITFDDGYRDNYTVAHPVLATLGAPALYFLPTQAIEERKVGWWDLFAYVVKQAGRPLAEATFHQEAFKKGTGPSPEQLATMLHVPLPTSEEQDAELMTWAQARELTVGSHTHSHRVLSSLSLDDQRAELSGSKRILEARLGRPIRALAYPVGGYAHFNLETKRLARECGYHLAFSYLTGRNPRPIDAYDVPRVEGPRSISLAARARRRVSDLRLSWRAPRAPRAIARGPSAS